jgi:hypothetical protein
MKRRGSDLTECRTHGGHAFCKVEVLIWTYKRSSPVDKAVQNLYLRVLCVKQAVKAAFRFRLK